MPSAPLSPTFPSLQYCLGLYALLLFIVYLDLNSMKKYKKHKEVWDTSASDRVPERPAAYGVSLVVWSLVAGNTKSAAV